MPELNRRQFSQNPMFDIGEPTVDPEQERQAHAGRVASQFGDLRVDMHATGAAGVLETGYIGTQHETSDSGGFYSPGYRDQIERGALGYEDNPVYGHLAKKPGDRSSYGDVSFTMKPHVKDRATLYPEDSWYAYEEHEAEVQHALDDGEEPPTMTPPVPLRQGLPDERNWAEAHIHRTEDPATHGSGHAARVPLQDVGRVDVDLSANWDERGHLEAVGESFHESGVPTWYQETHETYQPPLPYESQELEDQGFREAKVLRGTGRGHVRQKDANDRWSGLENTGQFTRSWRHGEQQ